MMELELFIFNSAWNSNAKHAFCEHSKKLFKTVTVLGSQLATTLLDQTNWNHCNGRSLKFLISTIELSNRSLTHSNLPRNWEVNGNSYGPLIVEL